MMKQLTLSLLGVLLPVLCWAQPEIIHLINPSFEDRPGAGVVPQGWFNVGFEGESPPDIQPGIFACTLKPLHGNTYLGLATRDNATWESVAQELSSPLLANVVYSFSIALAKPANFLSISRSTGKDVRFSDSVRLRIWGVSSGKNKRELLAESPIVQHSTWNHYHFNLRPSDIDVGFVLLEAHYGDPDHLGNGYLLLDHCSAFVPEQAFVSAATELPGSATPAKQSRLDLYNPSFEISVFNALPGGWTNTAESFTTDLRTHPMLRPILRSQNGKMEGRDSDEIADNAPVRLRPQHGKRYLSLLAANDQRRQQVSQRLDGFLNRDSTYTFSLYLAHARHFWEVPGPTPRAANFKHPLRLRIWGGTRETPNLELLAESPAVEHKDWKPYTFSLTPRKQFYDWITLEACYVSDIGKPYNGNILVDNCSAIELVVDKR